MTAIILQTKRAANWFGTLTVSFGDLEYLSDRALQDVGLARYRTSFKSARPFRIMQRSSSHARTLRS